MILVSTILFLILFTIGFIVFATKLYPDISKAWLPLWASLPVPALIFCYWLYGIWWIQSDFCTDVDNCDSGGMVAMTVGLGVGFFGSFFICFMAALIWVNSKRSK